MVEKILAAIDGSEESWKALDMACDLARLYGARLQALHVVPEAKLPEELHRYAEAEHVGGSDTYLYYEIVVEGLLREAKARAARKGLADLDCSSVRGRPVDVIVAAARDGGTDMVVMGRRGTGKIKGLLMGSVSQAVSHLAPCTCVTVT